MTGRVPGTPGNRDHLRRAVQGVYQCAGDQEWIAVSIGKIEQWRALCELMGKPELASDDRFQDMAGLWANHDEFDRIISEWTADKDNYELFHKLQAVGITAGPMMHEAHAFSDPHLKERGFFVEINAPEVGTHLYPGCTFKISGAPFTVRKPPSQAG